MLKEKTQSESEIENTRGSSEEDSSLKSKKSTKINLPPGWTRTTVTIREEHLEKLKDFAFLARIRQRDALELVLEDFFSKHQIPSRQENQKEALKLLLEDLFSQDK